MVRSSSRKRYGRGGRDVPLRFYSLVHLRIIWNRTKYVIGDRMMFLADQDGPLFGHAHPFIVRQWDEYVFQPVSKEVDRRAARSYPRRVFLVMITRIQFLFRGVRYSKWVLNRSEYFMQPWLPVKGGKNE